MIRIIKNNKNIIYIIIFIILNNKFNIIHLYEYNIIKLINKYKYIKNDIIYLIKEYI